MILGLIFGDRCLRDCFVFPAGFSVDQSTGLLTLIQLQESGGRIPWAFTLTGAVDDYLVVQNTNTRADLDPAATDGPDNVTVLARDAATGVHFPSFPPQLTVCLG